MKSLLGMLGITLLASLALALPASAAEHGKKHETTAAKPAVSSTVAAPTMPAKKDAKKP